MRVVIAREDSALRNRLRQAVLGLGLECKSNDCVSFDQLVNRLEADRADLVLVGLGADYAKSLGVLEDTYERTTAPIFAVGLSSDSENILRALRSGAREHIHEDEVSEGLLAALKKIRQAGIACPRWGKVIAVTGAQGGLGVTTVACNVGFALAGYYPGKIVLAELADAVPQLALNLDLSPEHGVDELAKSWDRMDAVMMQRALVTHPANLSVLAYRPDTLRCAELNPAAMRNTIILLRSMFDFAVVDLGNTLDDSRLEAFNLADRVVVVLKLDVPSLRLSRQYLKELDRLGVPKEKVKIIVNRFGQRQEFSWKKAQDAIGLTVAEWIPDDPARINKAANYGKPLVEIARGAPITKRFANLAQQLNGRSSNKN